MTTKEFLNCLKDGFLKRIDIETESNKNTWFDTKIKLYGGKNGSGNQKDYLNDINSFYEMIIDSGDVKDAKLIEIKFDLPDDLYYAEIGVISK